MQDLLDGEGEAITRKAIKLAKAGNEAALRLCLERLIAPRRERTVRLKLDLSRAEGISGAVAAILEAVARGEMTTGEAGQLANVLEVRRKAIETQEFERRLIQLENGMK